MQLQRCLLFKMGKYTIFGAKFVTLCAIMDALRALNLTIHHRFFAI